jgi:hypothetical protein
VSSSPISLQCKPPKVNSPSALHWLLVLEIGERERLSGRSSEVEPIFFLLDLPFDGVWFLGERIYWYL